MEVPLDGGENGALGWRRWRAGVPQSGPFGAADGGLASPRRNCQRGFHYDPPRAGSGVGECHIPELHQWPLSGGELPIASYRFRPVPAIVLPATASYCIGRFLMYRRRPRKSSAGRVAHPPEQPAVLPIASYIKHGGEQSLPHETVI